MPRDELSGPDLAGVVADANAVGLEHVVIGGFSLIYPRYQSKMSPIGTICASTPATALSTSCAAG
jgi:hypothetical protein